MTNKIRWTAVLCLGPSEKLIPSYYLRSITPANLAGFVPKVFVVIAFAAMYLSMERQAAAAQTYSPVPPLQRIYSLYNPATTDQILTPSSTEANSLTAMGWISTGDSIYMERQPQPATTFPLLGFAKGAPENAHLYTTNASQVPSPQWTQQASPVGHIYKNTEQLPGAIPLYQLSRSIPATSDVVYRYTLNASFRSTLISQGFQDRGILGYVYSSDNPTVAGGYVLGGRLGCNGASFRDCYFGSYIFGNAGPRPSGARQQVMRFKLWTPDMFATNPAVPTTASGEHIVFTPRGIMAIHPTDPLASTFHGIDLALGFHPGAGCPQGDTMFIEEWWPVVRTNPALAAWNNFNFTLATPPNTCGGVSLRNRTWYDVTVSVNNSGVATYTIRNGGALIATGTVQYGAAPQITEAPFPASATTYFLTNAHSAGRDYTIYITDFSVTWAASGACSGCAATEDCRCGFCWPTNLLCP